jgi:restriction endonuclease Mrr
LTQANLRLAREGRPPMFEEVKPNFWSLAEATGNSLAESYRSLDQWQDEHRDALEDSVQAIVEGLDDAAIGTLTTLLLDRLGYTEMQRHESSGSLGTISALAHRGLTSVRLAIRLCGANHGVNRDTITELRGSLHRFRASEGAIIALGSIDDAAREEIEVPNVAPISLLNARDFARHLIRKGVGLRTFAVEVSCMDDAFFRELKKR